MIQSNTLNEIHTKKLINWKPLIQQKTYYNKQNSIFFDSVALMSNTDISNDNIWF